MVQRRLIVDRPADGTCHRIGGAQAAIPSARMRQMVVLFNGP
jgi:hypothetical protein